MPALPSPGKILRLDFTSTMGSNTRIKDHLFFFYGSGPPTLADVTTWCTTVANAWGTNVAPQQSPMITLTAVQATDLGSPTGVQFILNTSKPGTSAGAGVDASAAAIIRFKIARRYRGGHPRFYLAGMTYQNMTNNTQWVGTYTAALQTAWSSFITAVEATPPTSIGTLVHYNVSYYQGFTNKTFPSGRVHPVPTPRATPVIDAVASYSVNPVIGNQRRRNQMSP